MRGEIEEIKAIRDAIFKASEGLWCTKLESGMMQTESDADKKLYKKKKQIWVT